MGELLELAETTPLLGPVLGLAAPALALATLLAGCAGDHGAVAEDVSGPLGSPVPYASDEQLAAFERGRAVAERRFAASEGLGPAFNITSCAGCHEKPVTGGAAGLYRNFFLGGIVDEAGAFLPLISAGNDSGVVRIYEHGGAQARPELPAEANVIAQRNPIPFFGVGLLAEVEENEILRWADPEDSDSDGISGRPNRDRGFVGRFGVKAQTVSIEGFIRGPLFNHLGISTDPLSEAQKAALPVDSSSGSTTASRRLGELLRAHAQAAAPDGPLADDDGAPDPELSTDDLFDLVSFAMLLAAPQLEEPTELAVAGRKVFDRMDCGGCHRPRLRSPRGLLPVYSDLLLHDMGPGLADGIRQGEATGAEFRTQPLWGISAVGPYLHDGRAWTIAEAIEAHGGEGQGARDAFVQASAEDRAALVEFLLSLGGREQATGGLLLPDDTAPGEGEWGGPRPGLGPDQLRAWQAGRRLFDREFGVSEGVGAPRFNGDSCRACHFLPVLGGAGPSGVDVMRHGIVAADGRFTPPAVGTILHRVTNLLTTANRAQPEATVFEARQTPHLFGLGLLEGVPRAAIEALADPEDADGDGISGRVSVVDGERLGRFGWKAQLPSIDEFVRDAITAELGMTLPAEDGLTFGLIQDNDAVPDPEADLAFADSLRDYLRGLDAPPRAELTAAAEAEGLAAFSAATCDRCHVPSLPGAAGPVQAFTDLLLHDVLPVDSSGIEEGSAGTREFRTAPLWGIRATAPYLHDGRAETLEQAIDGHAGEAAASRDAFAALPAEQAAALLRFLESL